MSTISPPGFHLCVLMKRTYKPYLCSIIIIIIIMHSIYCCAWQSRGVSSPHHFMTSCGDVTSGNTTRPSSQKSTISAQTSPPYQSMRLLTNILSMRSFVTFHPMQSRLSMMNTAAQICTMSTHIPSDTNCYHHPLSHKATTPSIAQHPSLFTPSYPRPTSNNPPAHRQFPRYTFLCLTMYAIFIPTQLNVIRSTSYQLTQRNTASMWSQSTSSLDTPYQRTQQYHQIVTITRKITSKRSNNKKNQPKEQPQNHHQHSHQKTLQCMHYHSVDTNADNYHTGPPIIKPPTLLSNPYI